ncbi:hypothetical protein AYO08_06315 [Pseudomonas putida]|nr:hypothetical protein AYO08_06315 [Pseudomonas putida]
MPARSRLEQYDHRMSKCADQATAVLAERSAEAVRRPGLKIGMNRFALAEASPAAPLKHQHLLSKRPVAVIANLAGVSPYFVIKRMKQLENQAMADLAGCSIECARKRQLHLNVSPNCDTR